MSDRPDEPFRFPDDRRVQVEPAPPLQLLDPLPDFILRLLTEARQADQAILDAGVLQLADRRDAQLIPHRCDLLGS